jgi:hypothetical protein
MKVTAGRALMLVAAFVIMVSMISISDVDAATKPKLSKTKATVEVGQAITLKVKNSGKSSVKWSTSSRKIATVSQKGKVKGVKSGSAKITAVVKINKKTYKIKCKITVTAKGTKNVSTQAGLNAALSNPKVTKINLKTSAAAVFTIPQGDYSNVALVVNAPNSYVANYGVFKSITIKSIKKDAFAENASGNSIKISASNVRVVVSSQAHPKKITVASSGANVIISADGPVDEITVEATGAYVVLSAKNTVKNLYVNGVGSIVAVASDSNVENYSVSENANILISGSREGSGGGSGGDSDEDTTVSPYSAAIGETYYKTLQEAVDSADTTPITVTLLKNVNEDVTIWTGNDITLDLNGCNITNLSKDKPTIFLYLDSKLTVEGSGIIDNTGSGQASVYNNGTLILNGGTYDRSTAGENNVYFTIVNHGRLTISGNALVRMAGGNITDSWYASLIQNGYTNAATDYVSNVGISKPTLTVTGGTFTGGTYSIENDERGVYDITAGNFEGYAVDKLLNYNQY